tara:strand:+ start:186 stop:914 length:729 start_codon:yes stop_codon:yes gene_type:complete
MAKKYNTNTKKNKFFSNSNENERFVYSPNINEIQVTDENSLSPSEDIVSFSKSAFSLQKEVYGKNKVKKILDEEFTEFIEEKKNFKEFFELYDSFFYDLSKDAHTIFQNESTEYLDYHFLTENQQVAIEIEKQINDIQDQIDSTERHHPIFQNRSIIGEEKSGGFISATSTPIYLMQSGRKRKIISDEIFNVIKSALKITKPNNDFIIFIPINGINGIENGPDITNNDNIFIDNSIVNTYIG